MLLHALLNLVQLAHLRLESRLDSHQRSAVGSRRVLSESRVRVPDREGDIGDLVAGEQVPSPPVCHSLRALQSLQSALD